MRIFFMNRKRCRGTSMAANTTNTAIIMISMSKVREKALPRAVARSDFCRAIRRGRV
ncbi:hypothetical protein D3C77_686430 [compost metagenome]